MTGGLDLDAPARLLAHRRVARLLDALAAEGEETRLVGGAVRNALLARPVSDIDLATTALPSRVAELARAARLKAVPTGIEHGTVTVLVEGQAFEVTTLREDVDTDGRHATVRFGRDFSADAARRDFTINALFLARDGRIHDTVGGLADLAARRVRFIGEPRRRIREDYLRTLRFFRLTAEYGEGAPDRDGLAACVAERAGLAMLSRERIRAELVKLVLARRGPELLAVLSGTGLLARLTGGVAEPGR
ncbi:MAG: CCA tRNA nucleotidyltransferase, partial [Methylobacteriaceae bacterium]|nr:CCA tRNA nucleotidyltransferase [Methylobacteriaceae bacterium]